MAVQTRRPGGSWVSVGRATDYANVVANYAAVLRQAQQVQSDVELENKVFQYKNGQLAYADLKSYLSTRLSGELPGSQRELDVRKLITEAGDYENKKNKEIERSKLEVKFAANGISAAERVFIENSLLQYFKEGTPEHTEQLSTIAAAKELQRQEDRAAKLANIEGRLSEGGLSTSEKIDIYEEAKGLTERGSKEYGELQAKVGELKQQKKEEDLAQKRNDLTSKLIDEFKEGGLNNEELLTINREMQRLSVPGSEDSVRLKEAEANLLGAIADEARAGAGKGKREQEEFAAVELQRLDAERRELQESFEAGTITDQEAYLSRLESILVSQQDIAGELPDAATPEFKGELLNRINNIAELSNAAKSGQVVTVKRGSKQELVPLSQLGGYSETVTTAGPEAFDEDGNLDPDSLTQENIVRVVVNGKEITYVLGEGGQLEQVKENEIPIEGGGKQKVYVKTGVVSSTKPKETQKGFATPTPAAPTQDFSSAANFSSATKGAVTVPAPKPSSSKSSSNKSSSSKSSSKATSINFSPVGNFSSVTGAIKNIQPSSSSKSQPAPSLFRPQPGKIKGTLDFGVTEALSSAASKVKNALSNIFKKR